MANKSEIHINPANKGKFNALKKKTGKSTEELTHSKNPLTRKRAVFAQNAKHFKHGQEGLTLLPEQQEQLNYDQELQDYQNFVQQQNTQNLQSSLPKVNLSTLPGSTLSDFNPTGEENKIRTIAMNNSLNMPKPKHKEKSNINWGHAALTGLLAVESLIPGQKPKDNIIRPSLSYNEHPYGTGSNALAEKGITISKDGYKQSSPDKNKKKLRIPSGNITMDGVGFPVLGTDNLGNTQYMLPGNDYQFPGSYVDEIPMAQSGMSIYKTQADVNAANTEAKRFMTARPNISKTLSQNAYVAKKPGDAAIRYIDSATGKDYIPAPTIQKKYSIPNDIALGDIKNAGNNSYYYNDPHTGDLVNNVDPSVLTLPRFKKPVEQINSDVTATSQLTKLRDGGTMKKKKGMYKAEKGTTILDENTVKFNGPSHADGGIPLEYGGKMVEVEGDETGYLSPVDDSLTIMGNLISPLTSRKFKTDSKILSEKEAKMDKLQDEGLTLINENTPMDKWSSLKFNSGKAMLTGAHKKKEELLSSKEHLKALQEAMLATSIEQDYNPTSSIEGSHKAKNGLKMDSYQDGGTVLKWKYNSTKTGGLDPKITEFVSLLEKKGLTGYSGPESGVSQRNTKQGRASRHASGEALDAFFSRPDAYNKVLADPELSKYLIDNGLTVINEYDPATASKTGATAGHLHIGYDKGTGVSDKFRKDAKAQYELANPNWGWGTTRNPKGKTIKGAPQGDQQFFPYNPGSVEYQDITTEAPPTAKKKPIPDYGFDFKRPAPYSMPSNAQGLEFTQILPELYAAASNKLEPVQAQKYQPELFEPYQVSFQDRLNDNNASFKSIQNTLHDNPGALSTLAGQKYSADSGVLADEFRTNQGIANDITNKNIALLNDAELKNLQIADVQYTRQSQAKSNTKAINHDVLNSISSKILQNRANQNKTRLYENLYNQRFDPTTLQAYNAGPGGEEYVDWNGAESTPYTSNPATSSSIRRNASGNVLSTTTNIPSQNKQQLEEYNLRKKKYTPIGSMLNKKVSINSSFAEWMAAQGL